MIKPNHMDKDKIYKTKDIVPALKYYGHSFDKIKTKHVNRARAIILGYKIHQSGLNDKQILAYTKKTVEDRDITNLLEYKELKSIRSWSIAAALKDEEKELELLRVWCMRLGGIALLLELSQKDIIDIAQNTEDLDCSVPKEF